MDERYTEQILRLAGYGEQLPEPQPAVPGAVVGMTARPAAVHESIPVMRVQAEGAAQPVAPRTPETEAAVRSFVQAPVNFAQPRDLQTEVLLEQVRELLRLAGRSEREWVEYAGLLESYLEWLRFRLER
jgi:hypothetical protein